MIAAVDWNELDGVLSFAPGSVVLYRRGGGSAANDTGGELRNGSAIVEHPDGRISLVKVTVETYANAEDATENSFLGQRLRMAGRVK